ncbi:hypothetical protein XELAEV_18027172mg [Xenopus laevis]|uniref:Uncharacterized protein n=1 Tax=Xenopus laevis TaxID=8355 RepID=A0A974CV04_XENLA|nr:hypothetical protein XELAEV_18027172mg [Xenopus laevis]
MKTFWWICLFFLFLTLIYGITGAKQDSNDDDDDDDYDVYEENSDVTDVPKDTEAQATNNENDDFDNDSNENEQQSEKDPEQARAQLETLPKNETELGMIKELLMRLDSNSQRNFIIICSVLGSGLFLVFVILVCLTFCIADLNPDEDELIKAEEGRANIED